MPSPLCRAASAGALLAISACSQTPAPRPTTAPAPAAPVATAVVVPARHPVYTLRCRTGLRCPNADNRGTPASCRDNGSERICLKACRWRCASVEQSPGRFTVVAVQRSRGSCWSIPEGDPFYLDGLRFEPDPDCPTGSDAN